MRNFFNLMQLVTFLRFGFTFGSIETPSPANTVAQTGPEHIKPQGESVPAGKDWKAQGKADAKEIMASDFGASSFKRVRLLERAKELAGMPGAEAWLEGYGEQYSPDRNNGTRKNRVSEARAIFAAWSGPHKAGISIEEAREKMENFTGGYQEFVDLVKELRLTANKGRAPGTENKTVSGKTVEKIEENVAKMTSAQALDVAKKATAQLFAATPKDAEYALIRKLVTTDLDILSKSDEKAIATAAEQAKERFSEILAAHEKMLDLQKAEKAAQASGTTTTLPKGTEGDGLEAPKPAETQEPVQQAVNS